MVKNRPKTRVRSLGLKNEEIDQCYLVYPKTDNFKRHVSLKDKSSNQLKMIPYSFTFINR